MAESAVLTRHPLDIAASMLEYPSVYKDVPSDIRYQIGNEAKRLRASIDHPNDDIVGWIVNDGGHEDWTTRFTREEQVRALGVLSIINSYSEEAKSKVTAENALADFDRIRRMSVPIGPLIPISEELAESLPALTRREVGRAAIHTARRIFVQFLDGPLEVYRAALANAAQKESEGDTSAFLEASKYLEEYMGSQQPLVI